MKDINLNNFIIENSLDIPLDVSIGVVSVPTGLNYSDQIKKVKEQNQHANMKFTFSDPDYSGLVDKFDWANSALIFAYDYKNCLLYTSPSPRDEKVSRMPSSA